MSVSNIYLWLVALVAVFVVSLTLGQYEIGFSAFAEYLKYKFFDAQATSEIAVIDSVIMEIRLPRVLLATLVGASLAISGVVFQAMFVNPLVSPSILGVLAGASFGAALGMLVSENWLVVQTLAFLFGFVAVGFAVLIGVVVAKSKSTVMLVLGGVISGSFFTSLVSIVKYVADPYSSLPAIVYWLMGSLGLAKMADISVVAIPMLISIAFMIAISKYLDVLSLGSDEAKALGINVKLVQTLAILLATLASSLSVVMAGVIGWVGLIVPHIVRMMVGASHKSLLPISAIAGAIFLILADNISRLLFTAEIPIGILTSLIGIPIFIFVLYRARSAWN